MDFYPPFEERDTDELIVLANSTEDYWQPEAIEMARNELTRRNVSPEVQLDKIRKWAEEFDAIEKEWEIKFNKERLQ